MPVRGTAKRYRRRAGAVNDAYNRGVLDIRCLWRSGQALHARPMRRNFINERP